MWPSASNQPSSAAEPKRKEKQSPNLALVLLVAVAGAGAALVAKLASKPNKPNQPPTTSATTPNESYDGLDSVVSFSSRMIAAARAMESRRPDRLFDDPLAIFFAGPIAMRRAEEREKKASSQPSSKDATLSLLPSSSPQPPRSRIAVRTRYFDDALLDALGALDATFFRPAPWKPIPFPFGAKRPRQVIMLGAGMDSRVWRLSLLPRETRWFEVDKGDVLSAKKKLLEEKRVATAVVRVGGEAEESIRVASLVRRGAMMEAGETTAPLAPPPTLPITTTTIAPPIDLRTPFSSPLRASSLAVRYPPSPLAPSTSAVATSSTLLLSSPSIPTFFPLFASSYHAVAADLEQSDWTSALRAAGHDASSSSVLLAEGLLMYLPERAVKSLLSSLHKISAKGSVLLVSLVNKAAVDKAKKSDSELMRQWKWGCPDDPTAFFAREGWKVVSCVQIGDPTASYGKYVETDASKETKTLYVRALVDK